MKGKLKITTWESMGWVYIDIHIKPDYFTPQFAIYLEDSILREKSMVFDSFTSLLDLDKLHFIPPTDIGNVYFLIEKPVVKIKFPTTWKKEIEKPQIFIVNEKGGLAFNQDYIQEEI